MLAPIFPRLVTAATFRKTTFNTFFTAFFADDFFTNGRAGFDARATTFGFALVFGRPFTFGAARFTLIAFLAGFMAGFAVLARFSLLCFAISVWKTVVLKTDASKQTGAQKNPKFGGLCSYYVSEAAKAG